MPIRTVGEYLRRWGYTAKRPARHARQQDPEEVRTWVEETYPEIEEQAQKEDAEILWGDETGVAADEHPQEAYARKGQPATMEVPGPHIRTNVIITLTNTGEVQYKTYDRTRNAAFFVVFLEELLRTTRQKIILIVDRLTAHTAQLVQDGLAAHRDRIEVRYLPAYAPERNPEEYLNQDLKSNVHSERLPDTKPELLAQVQAFLRKLQNLPKHVMAYFQHPKVQYAAS